MAGSHTVMSGQIYNGNNIIINGPVTNNTNNAVISSMNGIINHNGIAAARNNLTVMHNGIALRQNNVPKSMNNTVTPQYVNLHPTAQTPFLQTQNIVPISAATAAASFSTHVSSCFV